MQKIIGNEVDVFFKNSSNVSGDVSGLLIDVTDDSIYVQDTGIGARVFIVPKSNIDFCTTNQMSPQRPIIKDKREVIKPTAPESTTQVIDRISVYVNQQQVASIPIPPTFKVDVWSESILKVLMGNPDVQNSIAGRSQKSLEYYPGEVYIEVEEVTPPSQMPDTNEGYGNSFTMGGSPSEQYLTPLQMAARLNKVIKRDKNDDNSKEPQDNV